MIPLAIKNLAVQTIHSVIPMIVVGALVGGTMWYIKGVKSDRDAALKDVATLKDNYLKAEGVISEQKLSIDSLLDLRKLDAETLAGLTKANSNLSMAFAKRQGERAKLEKTNVQVKTYLDVPVPDDLRRLLDNAGAKYRGPDENQGRTTTSPAAGRPTETVD